MSRDIPIIFSAPMVQALLAGRKTMTRRLAWRTRFNPGGHIPDGVGGQMDFVEPHEERIGPSPWQKVKPGDRLYVRENWAPGHAEYKDIVIYQADGIRGAWMYDGDGVRFLNRTGFVSGLANPDLRGNWIGPPEKWRPCIHLPRKYSRLTLEVTAVKVEPVQAISEDDALAEGIICYEPTETDDAEYSYERGGTILGSASEAFKFLWIKLHGLESWKATPDVVAMSFTVHRCNIDSMEKAA